MSDLKRRIHELEKRHGAKRFTDFAVWVSNPLDGSDPEPRPEALPGVLLFEVTYTNPPVYPDVAQ